MKPIQSFSIQPSLPERLEPLRKIAYNLRWAWNHDTIELFRRLDSELWETTNHNPVWMLGKVRQGRLEEAVKDQGFLAHMDRVSDGLNAYLEQKSTWFDREKETDHTQPLVAYLSAEFALTECLEIFAGGLGVLAGDHLKSSSDLGLPLVGVGLLYQEGYFRQYLNEAGRQQEFREENDFPNLPLVLERTSDGSPLTIKVSYPSGVVHAQIWRVQVGRIPLYLLDTNIKANPDQDDRDITDELYGGDKMLRIRQEMMLGIGGYRALKALGQSPHVYHLNEGHAAFLGLEFIRDMVETQKLTFDQARELAKACLIFTTHTPVPAGHDYFSMDMIRKYFGHYAQKIGLEEGEFLALGRDNPRASDSMFCMTTLALKLAGRQNAVSQLHAKVTREMWQVLWPGVPQNEIPISHVTNGVHYRSWISLEMNQLYDRYLGPRWREEPADKKVWGKAERIASSELWRTHERRRERLVAFVRRQLREQRQRRGAPQYEIDAANEALDPQALTIGFARRFATYKRSTLIFHDEERLARLFRDQNRPIQIIFSGKAHPKDEGGKDLIARIVELSRREPFRNRLVFLEDYGMATARYLVQGCDVWLNTPRRPREACGTSGMKATANGGLNLSILDGWWAEAYDPKLGWAIGRGETYEDTNLQDKMEAEDLYELLEREVVPIFYKRGGNGQPNLWVERMKASMRELCSVYNTHRMVQQYTEDYYLPASQHTQSLTDNKFERTRGLTKWKETLVQNWPEIQVLAARVTPDEEYQVGDKITAKTSVHLAGLSPEDVTVSFYFGRLDVDGEIVDAEAIEMLKVESDGDHNHHFETKDVICEQSGRYGYTIRILPSHPDLITPYLPHTISWAGPGTPQDLS